MTHFTGLQPDVRDILCLFVPLKGFFVTSRGETPASDWLATQQQVSMFGTSFFEPFHVEHAGGAYSCHCSRILRRAAHWGVRPGSSRAQLAVVLAVAQHCRDCCHTVCLPDESLSAAHVDKNMGVLVFLFWSSAVTVLAVSAFLPDPLLEGNSSTGSTTR